MSINLLWVFGIVICLIPILEAHNILMALPLSVKSHKYVFDPVAEELAKRGHNITFFSGIKEEKKVPGIRNYYSEDVGAVIDNSNISFFRLGNFNSFNGLKSMFALATEMTEKSYSDPLIEGILKEPRDPATGKPKFDVVVVDSVFNDFMLPLAHHLGVPNIILSPCGTYIQQAWNLDVPYPYAVHPSPTMDLPTPLSFGGRVTNTFGNMLFNILMNYVLFPSLDDTVRRFLPDSPSILELEKNVSFMISNTHPPLTANKPSMPYAVELGGLNCYPAKSLPKDLENFMQSAGKHGVVFFSLGSYTKGETMPEEMREKILAAFAQLPQKVLFKFENDLPSLPPNVKLIKWAPQQDLIGHRQMRLFITHCGGLSTSEAAYHGCPILGFPLTADQIGNAASAKRQGFGEYLDWKTFTAQELADLIKKNNQYQKLQRKCSTCLNFIER